MNHAIANTTVALLAITFACLASPAQVRADIVIEITQNQTGVTAAGTGSLILSGSPGVAGAFPPGINPSAATLGFGPSNVGLALYTDLSGPTTWGSGTLTSATTSSGSFLLDGAQSFIELPSTYSSGQPITLAATWAGSNFSSLGITPGDYTYTFGPAPFQSTITVEVGSVPEPSSIWLAATGGAVFSVYALFARKIRLRQEAPPAMNAGAE
jgi:hypothetical protein